MSWIEWAGFVSGAICVLLVVREKVANFPIGIVNNVVYFVLFLQAGLYADSALQVVFLGLGLQGWYLWVRGGVQHTRLEINPLPRDKALALGIGIAIGTAVMAFVLAQYTDSTLPFWDGLTTALSLGAQWLLNRKHTANWYVWIVADLLYVGVYLAKDLRLTAVLYAGFLGLCVLGLQQWKGAEAERLVLAA